MERIKGKVKCWIIIQQSSKKSKNNYIREVKDFVVGSNEYVLDAIKKQMTAIWRHVRKNVNKGNPNKRYILLDLNNVQLKNKICTEGKLKFVTM